MKKTLFFLFIANAALAQTDTTGHGADSLKVIFKDEVIVNATRAKQNSPTTYQYIGKAELNKNNLGQDLPFLLDNTPSAVTTSDAGAGVGYTGIRIRGSDNTRVNVTLNGIPVNDAESQGTFWVDLPDVASSAQSIQIQRGVGGSTNGGSAFGGTVSVQTQTASPKPFVEAEVSAGSFHTFRGNLKVGSGLLKQHYFIEGSGSWIVSDGYVDRASSNLQSWFFQTGYQDDKTLVKLLYFGGGEKTYQAWYGVSEDSLKVNRTYNEAGTDYGSHFPPYKNQTDNYKQHYLQLLLARQLPSHFYLNAGLFATLGKGYYEEYKTGAAIQSYFETMPSAYTDLVRQLWLNNIFYGGTFALNYDYKKVSATLGGLLAQYRGKQYGKVIWAQEVVIDKSKHYYDGHSTKNDFNVYVKFNYELFHHLNLYADVQYRYVGYTTKGVDDSQTSYEVSKTWHFINPKAGLLYQINPQHQLYASYALGHREPNRDDLLAALYAGREVKAEMMHDVEAGYKLHRSDFPFSINYYLMYYNNQLVLTGRLTNVGSPIKENVPVSYRTGVELTGSFNFKRKSSKAARTVPVNVFSIHYSFAYSFNKIKSFDEYIYTYDENYVPVDTLTIITNHHQTDISFSPSFIASLELVLRPLKGLSVSLMTKAVSKQYLDNTQNDNRKLKPFTYSNINITYSVPLKQEGKEITLKLLLNNVLNRLYESNGYTWTERYAYDDGSGSLQTDGPYTYNYYYPQAGFNFLAGVNVRF